MATGVSRHSSIPLSLNFSLGSLDATHYIHVDALEPQTIVGVAHCHLWPRAGPSRRRAGAEAAAATPAGHRRAGRWSRTLGFVTTLVQESATLRMLINSQKKGDCRKLKLETFVSWNILYL